MSDRYPFFSIVVPVYNAEKYLDECLQSILNQTFKDFEVILINDGSTDRSWKICQKYAKKDTRIKIYEHENRGEGYTRDRAFKLARGIYITGLDADDIMKKDTLKERYLILREEKPDILLCATRKMNEEGILSPKFEHWIDRVPDINFSRRKFMPYLWDCNNGTSATTLLRSFLTEHNIEHPVKRYLIDDKIFLYSCILKASKITLQKKAQILVRLCSNSIQRGGGRICCGAIETCDILLNELKENNVFNPYRFRIYTALLKTCFYYYGRIQQSLKPEFHALFQKFCKNNGITPAVLSKEGFSETQIRFFNYLNGDPEQISLSIILKISHLTPDSESFIDSFLGSANLEAELIVSVNDKKFISKQNSFPLKNRILFVDSRTNLDKILSNARGRYILIIDDLEIIIDNLEKMLANLFKLADFLRYQTSDTVLLSSATTPAGIGKKINTEKTKIYQSDKNGIVYFSNERIKALLNGSLVCCYRKNYLEELMGKNKDDLICSFLREEKKEITVYPFSCFYKKKYKMGWKNLYKFWKVLN